MKIVSFTADGRDSYGFVDGEKVVDVGAMAGGDLKAFLASRGHHAMSALADDAPRHSLDAIDFLPTVPNPDKIFCIGLNYLTHIRETGREPPAHPPLFLRVANAQVGQDVAMIRPRVSTAFDFEGELAVVIGQTCRHVSKERALDVVAGYTCFNDGSIRDWQRHTSQFGAGKNFHRSGAMGPWLVTTDEVPDPGTSSLETRLNGEVMQSARLDDLVFGVADLIEYLSTVTVLEPGDVIATGTPGGVGAFRDPKIFMKPGDVIEVEIGGIGILRNPIEDEI